MRRERHTIPPSFKKCQIMALCMSALIGGTARADEPQGSFVLKAGTVLTVAGDGAPVYSPGMVIVRDGKIVAVGQNLAVPADLEVIELPDGVVMPGLVAASTSLAPAHTGDESVAAGYRAVDGFLPYADYRSTLAGGVTTVHLNPGRHRLVTGQGAVVKLGGPNHDRVLMPSADLSVTFAPAVYHPPKDVNYQTPSSSDVAIPQPIRQRPDSRMGQVLAFEEALALAEPREFASLHLAALGALWQDQTTIRVHVDRAADMAAALEFFRRHKRRAYFVGGAQADLAVEAIRAAGVPVVFELGHGLRNQPDDLGYDPDALAVDVQVLRSLSGVTLALAAAPDGPVVDLRLAGATALQAELSREQVIEALTRIPAEILGVSDRVGSLQPGKDADLLVLSGDPLRTSTHVHRVYISGRIAFEAPETNALVVRGGTVWVNEHEQIADGSVLIEDGKITAVGKSVPHPPFAKFINAGEGSFVVPGFIDAHGHLGLEGDRASTAPELKLSKTVGVPDVAERRVARAGVTTVLLAPYGAGGSGSQVAAVHTGGSARKARVVRETAGVYFDLSDTDPAGIGEKLKARYDAGKKYLETWRKYEKELADWKEKKAKGEPLNGKPKIEVVEDTSSKGDPITGTWSATVSGGPLPEPQTATMRLRLTGEEVEGRMTAPGAPGEVKVMGTFVGKHLSLEFDVDTGGQGTPRIEADLVAEDKLVGKVSVASFEIDFEAERTDKEAVEFKVTKRRTRGKDGRPLPPKTDEALEPIRSILEKKIPALVKVTAPAQIAAVIKFMDEWETPYLLLDAPGARAHATALAEKGIGVVVPKEVIRWEQHEPYHQSDDLSRRGVSVAFQSDAEDAARVLPLMGLHAVERGLAPDAALAALTTKPAKMFLLEDHIGSLKPGCQGDLAIFSGHPFETGSAIQRVIVHGEEVR